MHVNNVAPEVESYYIVGTSSAPAVPPLVLKHDDTFGVFDRFGDVDSADFDDSGLYCRGTRHLSLLRLRLAGERPLLLSSTVRSDGVVLATDLTNPDFYADNRILLPRGSLHIYRSQFLQEDVLYHRIRIRNFSQLTLPIRLTIDFGADFADIFEVRGTQRQRRGELRPPRREGNRTIIEYLGLDGVLRRTLFDCPLPIGKLTSDGYRFEDELTPEADKTLELTVAFESGDASVTINHHDECLLKATREYARGEGECFITTSNEQFNNWLDRSRNDLCLLITQTPEGPYPYAGVPWFATPFGRDGIITALECLWVTPGVARGVLKYLTRTQATTTSPEQDAQPGKILHEARDGEMAALHEIPFGRYYGSVDATPLYLLLAAAYFKRTGDTEFLTSIWHGVDRALQWIDHYGDQDQDGFVEYFRMSSTGLVQQGWKDSHDSIFHRDGRSAEPPIALCEVQAYVYAAKLGLAEVAEAIGMYEESKKLFHEATALRRRFEEAFWSPELGMYVLAIDGHKQPCDVRTSNAGHALFCGISGLERARAMAENFFQERFDSGWGIRTVADGEARYNPMSYHNGSIWPHDNALIAAGLARYEFTEMASRIMTGLFQAAASLEWNRLPELFCGFERRHGKTPTQYPTACSPQAWAAAASFLLLQSSIGLSIDARAKEIVLRHPVLPTYLERVDVRNLAVGAATVDLRLFRSGDSVAVTVERRVGELDIMVIP
jgi:glycogen debranching enzyme